MFLDAVTLSKPEIFIGNCSQKIDAKTGQITDQADHGIHRPAARQRLPNSSSGFGEHSKTE